MMSRSDVEWRWWWRIARETVVIVEEVTGGAGSGDW